MGTNNGMNLISKTILDTKGMYCHQKKMEANL
jgi:hypothetical protein